MRSNELFRSCANEHVAAAALACIGGPLEKRVAIAAQRAGLSSGAFVARLVADYDRKASPGRRKSLEKGMFRNQTPILAGLRHVVQVALEGAWDNARDVAQDVAQDVPWDIAGERAVVDGKIRWSGQCAPAMRNEPVLKGLCN